MGKKEMQVFQNDQFGEIRTVMYDGEPWFVAADVCRVLEIANPSDALSRLDDDERMTLDSTEGHSGQRGGAQKFNCINEPGLYTLVLGLSLIHIYQDFRLRIRINFEFHMMHHVLILVKYHF